VDPRELGDELVASVHFVLDCSTGRRVYNSAYQGTQRTSSHETQAIAACATCFAKNKVTKTTLKLSVLILLRDIYNDIKSYDLTKSSEHTAFHFG
jgi:hypothetical protein